MRLGKQTVTFEKMPYITATAAIVGPYEGEGPLKDGFDRIIENDDNGEKSWEKAETKLMQDTYHLLLQKGNTTEKNIHYVLAGDLLNQNIASSYAFRDRECSYLGIYGACSTFGEAVGIASMIMAGGFAEQIICITSSHYCSAERQYRYPLEFATQRPPTSQWTVTGSGGLLLQKDGTGPVVEMFTAGKIVDQGIKDANNMGAAMAPAAADTIATHFVETGRKPEDYDLIVTGDLGAVGTDICRELLKQYGFDVFERHEDCGLLMYDRSKQDAHSGASGCGCCATVFSAYFYPKLRNGELTRILFVPTGALLSPTIVQQGESIACIAHAVAIDG
jgi:stage V sporulation protein AD